MITVTEDYVSFETAKLLKEKGFDEPCECFYDTENNDPSIVNGWMVISNSELEKREFVCYSAPTLQMAIKWLRENHKIQIVVSPYNTLNKTWSYYIFKDFEPLTQRFYVFETYEEACEAAIKYCLENLI